MPALLLLPLLVTKALLLLLDGGRLSLSLLLTVSWMPWMWQHMRLTSSRSTRQQSRQQR
jgi:hypothetical protein